jgi:UDP-GlcNAc3NAcA epimerase
MMKIITIVGARPQFVKAAVVSRAFKSTASINEIIVHTGQHYDEQMSEVFFREMEIPKPAINLEVRSSFHGEMTGQMLTGIEKILLAEKPHAVMVYGDTNSTLAGALAASKLHIKLIHVEAGLRSFNMNMPEEINRILTDRISNLLCCPTDHAIANLKKEGFENMNCHFLNTGDVMEDAAKYYALKSADHSTILKKIGQEPFILCTLHRAENTNDVVRLKEIIAAINELNKRIRVILPLHPRTLKTFNEVGVKPECTLIEPVGYFDMLELLKHCSLVLTDSGGLQKEAFFFEKFCVTLREETEWLELVENGFNLLAGADRGKIISAADQLLSKKSNFNLPLYGGGNAGENVVKAIERFL